MSDVWNENLKTNRSQLLNCRFPKSPGFGLVMCQEFARFLAGFFIWTSCSLESQGAKLCQLRKPKQVELEKWWPTFFEKRKNSYPIQNHSTELCGPQLQVLFSWESSQSWNDCILRLYSQSTCSFINAQQSKSDGKFSTVHAPKPSKPSLIGVGVSRKNGQEAQSQPNLQLVSPNVVKSKES